MAINKAYRSTRASKDVGVGSLGDCETEEVGINLEVVKNHAADDCIGRRVLERSKL